MSSSQDFVASRQKEEAAEEANFHANLGELFSYAMKARFGAKVDMRMLQPSALLNSSAAGVSFMSRIHDSNNVEYPFYASAEAKDISEGMTKTPVSVSFDCVKFYRPRLKIRSKVLTWKRLSDYEVAQVLDARSA